MSTPSTDAPTSATAASLPRLISLDQFRGYTVLGMFLVNFVGSFAAIKAGLPLLKHHHTFCSYADTIMPQFLFAVGFAYRLTFLRRREKSGLKSAYEHAIWRNLGLLLVAFVIHHIDGRYENWSQLRETGVWGVVQAAFQRNFFQTLAHIACTSLWVLPVMAARGRWRILYAIGSAVLFQQLSNWWYYDWVMHRPGIDGGPLGFISWSIPLLLGTLAYDMMTMGKRPPVISMVAVSAVVMLVGYGLSCLNLITEPNQLPDGASWQERLIEPPFVAPTRPVNTWTMSQRAGSLSYVTFGAGFSMLVYALFVVACDLRGCQIGIFRTFGTNALAGYIIHDLVNEAVKPLFPNDSPMWYVWLGFATSLGICYLFLRHLEKHRLFLRL